MKMAQTRFLPQSNAKKNLPKIIKTVDLIEGTIEHHWTELGVICKKKHSLTFEIISEHFLISEGSVNANGTN